MEYAASYKHSSINHSFESADDKSIHQAAFFQFSISKEIDYKKLAFGISVMQQGERLANYRKEDEKKKFKPSKFNIILMNQKC